MCIAVVQKRMSENIADYTKLHIGMDHSVAHDVGVWTVLATHIAVKQKQMI